MNKEKEYRLLVGNTTNELSAAVNTYLKDGWRLSGVPQCSMAAQSAPNHPCAGEMYYVFVQAVVKG